MRRDVKPDIYLLNFIRFNVKMLTKTNMYCNCPTVYVRRYQKKKTKKQQQMKQKYISLYSKFNYMKRWLRTKSKASKISTDRTFKNASQTHIVKTYLPHNICTLPCQLNGSNTGPQNHVTVYLLHIKGLQFVGLACCWIKETSQKGENTNPFGKVTMSKNSIF